MLHMLSKNKMSVTNLETKLFSLSCPITVICFVSNSILSVLFA